MNQFDGIIETDNCKNCKNAFKWQVEVVKNVFIEAQRYNTIVCTIGYGSLITIFNFAKDDLNDMLKLPILLSFAISICIFVLIEMKNIEHLQKRVNELLELLYYKETEEKPILIFFLKDIYNNFYKKDEDYKKENKIFLDISFFTGAISFFLLIIGLLLPFLNHSILNYIYLFILI
jgi:hypothetical protein